MADRAILLVEDNPDDRDLMLRALRQADIPHRVVVVDDGVKALDYLFGTAAPAGQSPAPLPLLVLLDLKLPRLDGLEVLERVRTNPRTRSLPVIMLTLSRERADIRDSYLLGANCYIAKPVDFREFAQVIRQTLTFWLVTVELPPQEEHDGHTVARFTHRGF